MIVLLSLSVLAYAWLAYPLLLRLFSAGRKRRAACPAQETPDVVVLISAHNEEAHIRDRLRNIQDLDYPADRITVLVGVDGGTDRTAEIAGEIAAEDARIRVVAFPENRGKVAVLKELVSLVNGPMSGSGSQVSGFRVQVCGGPLPPSTLHPSSSHLLVFTDANTMFRRDALGRLVAPFADASVGGVCGRLVFAGRSGPSDTSDESDRNPAVPAESVYWTWESAMKEMESGLDSCLGANGGIYAMRPDLFWKDIPSNTIIDDFVLGMKVREQGRRMVYEPGAVAEEETPDSLADEWRRRVRIGAGDFQATGLCRRCLLPRFGWFAWAFWSHKVLRWFTPHVFIVGAAGVLWMGGGAVGRLGCGFAGALDVFRAISLGGLLGFLCCAAAGWLMGKCKAPVPRIFLWCHYFAVINAALMAGFVRFCRGNLSGRWDRTPRKGLSTNEH